MFIFNISKYNTEILLFDVTNIGVESEDGETDLHSKVLSFKFDSTLSKSLIVDIDALLDVDA